MALDKQQQQQQWHYSESAVRLPMQCLYSKQHFGSPLSARVDTERLLRRQQREEVATLHIAQDEAKRISCCDDLNATIHSAHSHG